MNKLNIVLSCIVALLVAYIFKEDVHSSGHPPLVESDKCEQNVVPTNYIKQQKKTVVHPNSEQVDTSTNIVNATLNDAPPSKDVDSENIEVAIEIERNERIEQIYNADYTMYFEDELREMGKNNDLRAQLELSLRISESRDKSLYKEGEFWARKAIIEANKQGDKVLLAVAAEQMSSYAMLKGARVEDYAWIALGANSGSAILQSRLEVTRKTILNLTEYETKLANLMVPILESMIKNGTLADSQSIEPNN